MKLKKQRLLDIPTRLSAGSVSVANAAQLLARSPRQLPGLHARFRQEGIATVLYANQGHALPTGPILPW